MQSHQLQQLLASIVRNRAQGGREPIGHRLHETGVVVEQPQFLNLRGLRADRLPRIAPFLRYDKDPYLVVRPDGSLIWIQDAYTVSDKFPNAQAFDPTTLPMFGSFLHVGAWPIVMGITMWFQMKLNPAPPDPTQKMIFDWMPLIFTFMLASFSAGLVIYWAWNNTLSVIQQSIIMKKNGAKIELFDMVDSYDDREKGGCSEWEEPPRIPPPPCRHAWTASALARMVQS